MEKKVDVNKQLFSRVESVGDLIEKDIFNDVQKSDNEMLDLIEHVQRNAVPLTENQVEAMFLLNEMGLDDIGKYAVSVRPMLSPINKIFELINKITLADRIKGNAKLSNLLKTQVASPSANIPASELQAKPMKDKEFAK